jgi:hypothetical protein
LRQTRGYVTLALGSSNVDKRSDREGNVDDERETLVVRNEARVARTPAAQELKPSTVGDWAGRLTLLGAELAYLGLVSYLIFISWDSKSGVVPGVSDGIIGLVGALATAFGLGYASVLGVQPPTKDPPQLQGGAVRRFFQWLDAVLTVNNLLGAGILFYMASGTALGVTYLANQNESPGVVKTIAVAFGGYVVAYIGKAYQNYLAPPT